MLSLGGVNAGARLDRLPLAGFHRHILILISSGGMLDAFDVYLAGSVLAAMRHEKFATLGEAATFMSVTSIGMLIGAILAGQLGDRFGRRYSYQFNLWIFGLSSFAAAFAPTMNFLIAARFIMGIGLGAEFVVAAGTLGEFIPPTYRGRWASIMGLLTSSGLLVATATSYFVIPSLGWRAMFVIGGIAAIIICLMGKQMPESPRWLEAVGRTQEAEEVLAAIEAQVAAQKGTLPAVTNEPRQRRVSMPRKSLFERGLRGRLIVASLITVAVNTSVYGLVTWLPVFLVGQGKSVSSSLALTSLISVGSTVGSLLGIAIADRVPRRPSLIGAAFAIALFGVFYILSSGAAVPVTGFLLVSSIYLLSNQGMYSYVPELFPTAYRLRGTGLAGTCARATSIATPYITMFLFGRFGLPGVMAMIAVVLAAMVIGVSCLKIEPSRKSLDELDETGGDSDPPAFRESSQVPLGRKG